MKKKYWVVWNRRKKLWQAKKTGNAVALKNFPVKENAVKYASDMARRNAPSIFIIKNQDGTVAEEKNYTPE